MEDDIRLKYEKRQKKLKQLKKEYYDNHPDLALLDYSELNIEQRLEKMERLHKLHSMIGTISDIEFNRLLEKIKYVAPRHLKKKKHETSIHDDSVHVMRDKVDCCDMTNDITSDTHRITDGSNPTKKISFKK